MEMATVMIRPDLRTAGGETNDIMLDDQFVGTLTLVYRESDRISGSIQLEEESLNDVDKVHVLKFVQRYIQGLIDATQAEECYVVVTHSVYEDIISTSTWEDQNVFEDVTDNIIELESSDYDDLETTGAEIERPCSFFELVMVGESQYAAEYHIHDEDGYFIAEAYCEIQDNDVIGSVDWMFHPLDDEMEGVANLLVANFEDDEIDSYIIDMLFEGEIVDIIELTNEALFDDLDENAALDNELDDLDDDYIIEMVRDDGDALTYEIYQRSYGVLPIGTATVDLTNQLITGFIDLRKSGGTDDRLHIAKRLMDEIDKEKDCDHLGVTMMCGNEFIEELIIDSE